MDTFNTDDFLNRFEVRAAAVKKRSIPPITGDDRTAFIKQAEIDYIDFSLVANSEIEITKDSIILKIELESSSD